jgi:hypothetical protein
MTVNHRNVRPLFALHRDSLTEEIDVLEVCARRDEDGITSGRDVDALLNGTRILGYADRSCVGPIDGSNCQGQRGKKLPYKREKITVALGRFAVSAMVVAVIAGGFCSDRMRCQSIDRQAAGHGPWRSEVINGGGRTL